MKLNKKIIALGIALIFSIRPQIVMASGPISVSRAFYELARQGNTPKIEALINRGYSIESVDERGYNPICLSVIKQNKTAYDILTYYGAKAKPDCLKKIPESVTRRFLGETAPQEPVKKYVSDTPYLMGTAIVATGAAITAYALRGATGGGSKSDSGDPSKPNNPDDPNNPDKPDNPSNPDNPNQKCPDNSSYINGKCVCDAGYGNHKDAPRCYKTIAYCADQNKNICNKCTGDYVLQDNVCYPPIRHCSIQNKDECTKCDSGYGTHGNPKACYEDIEFCEVGQQNQNKCLKCINGYGTHGDDSHCYKDIPNCLVHSKDICTQCMPNYDTYGDPYACYLENPCALYPNSVPVNFGSSCACDAKRGYTGDPYDGGCSQADEGNYKEGDEENEKWDDYNARYCHSHGKYDINTGTCDCYVGYSRGPGSDCSTCAENYLQFGSLCFRDIKCDASKHLIQQNDKCICDYNSGYISYDNGNGVTQCIEKLECELHHKQDGEQCVCKPNFVDDCTRCPEEDGYTYNIISDSCIKTSFVCDKEYGHWTGDNCDICPSQYLISEDGLYCGMQCAPNRLDISQNPDCSLCAEGYIWSDIDQNCVTNECTRGEEGYILIRGEDGTQRCTCDTEAGYAMNAYGKCEPKAADLKAITDNNVYINNSEASVKNDGVFRDVYGMKPYMTDDAGNKTYFDSVYNAYGVDNENSNATLDITNMNIGNNVVYGIYAPSEIYNAAAVNISSEETTSRGLIKINDENTLSAVYGIKVGNEENRKSNAYNAFASNSSQKDSIDEAYGEINITKDKTSSGNITGIEGNKNIYNAYAYTNEGIGANARATGKITMEHKGKGSVIGIRSTGSVAKINNALAYLNSVIADSVAEGNIALTGTGNVYGILGGGTIINSETQFDKSYNMVKDFKAIGNIDVTTLSDSGIAYGIYSTNNNDNKAGVYNAFGYNTQGTIKVTNSSGGSAYGIYTTDKTYVDRETGDIYYNNIYNAFRSSAKYGDSVSKGTIDVITGTNSSQLSQNIAGIFAAGNVYNAYANSGSDIPLGTEGIINVTDKSKTATVKMYGIRSDGITVANAYGTGENLNDKTRVHGSINIDVNYNKEGQSEVYGMYTNARNTQISHIYNAALVNDKSNVIGEINLTTADFRRGPSKMYGIYAVKGDADDQPKKVYNAYYENSTDIADGHVEGTIKIIAGGTSGSPDARYYGIYVEGGEAYNVKSTNSNADVKGTITVDAYGGTLDGQIIGMYGRNSVLDNSGKNAVINVTSRGKAYAYGIRGENSNIYNSGTINVNAAGESDAAGIYAEIGTVVNDTDGVINVTGGGRNYGIYAKSDGNLSGAVTVVNAGKIIVTGSQATGIYATGYTAQVSNTGKITLKGTPCEGDGCNQERFIVLKDGAKFINSGEIDSTSTINFNDWGENVEIGTGGSFAAKDKVSGDLKVSTAVIADNFDSTSTLKDAISTEDASEVVVTSQSYLYNAKLEQNEDKKYDIVLNMKDFEEVTDKNTAAYLEENYAKGNNKELYNALKQTANSSQYSQREADILATSVLPNMVGENLKIERSLDRNMMNNLFKEGGEVRKMVGADVMYIGQDDHGTLTGYDIDSQSTYALYDKKMDNNYRLGLGMSLTRTNTDYNNDSSRKNLMIQGYVPLVYTNPNGITFASMARLGYSDGDYRRRGYNQRFEADTSEITYGLLNEVRYKSSIGSFNLTPFAGLNAIGYYQNSIHEGDTAMAVNVASANIFSLESALGLYLDRDIEFNEDNQLNVALGIGYYHEFSNPYRGLDAQINDTIGTYKLRNADVSDSRDRGILSAKINYDYKDFSIYGELMQYLEKEYPLKVDVGLKYKF